jgi:hypothetical protein
MSNTTMLQHLVKFRLTGDKRIYPSAFRDAIAKQLNDPTQENLFHYKNGQGANGHPLNRFVGGKGWVGFISEESESMAAQVLAPGIKVLKQLGINAGIELISESKTAFLCDEPVLYAISSGIDKRSDPKRRNLTDAQYINHMIWKMLETASEQGVLDILPVESELNLTVFESTSVGIKAGHNRGEGNLHYHKVHGKFAMNMRLTGLWQAGQLLSRGNGQLYKINNGGFYQC